MHIIFKGSIFFMLLFLLAQNTTNAASHNFDKANFYKVLAGTNLDDINTILTSLKETTIPEKIAYEGALLMKKAGLLKKPKEKLSTFKAGRAKLEAAIQNADTNIEYHFLRLVIQEHAPKVVKYSSNQAADAELVKGSFKKLTPEVQQAVKDYTKSSSFLKPTDF